MDARAFEYCTTLKEIDASKATSIGSFAFVGCTSLEYADISNTSSIGNSAFSGCSSLKTVICTQTTPPTLGETVFWGAHNDLKIYVPTESVETYKASWVALADRIVDIAEYNPGTETPEN